MNYADYSPSAEVRQHIKQVDLVALIGPTGAGKTTLIKQAVEHDNKLHMLVSGVSRAPRSGEVNGVDYHFGDKATMAKRVQKRGYVTVVEGVSGDLYTTAPEDYPHGKIVLMAVLADAMPMFRNVPYRSIKAIFIVPPSLEIWRQRLTRHGFGEPELARRLKEAKASLEFAVQDDSTFFVINNDLKTATQDVIDISTGRPLTARQTQDQSRARQIAKSLIGAIG